MRRCTRCLSASSRIDNPARLSRLICSNSSTLDRAIPTSTPDDNDVEVASRVGPEFVTTRRPHQAAGSITTQAEPNFVKNNGQTGASSGDHTHLLDAVAGFALAAALLAWPRPLAGLVAAGYTAATLGALLISLSVGPFGFRESISASYVAQSLAIETITLLALLSWAVLAAATPGPPARRRGPWPSQPL